jgi:SagB-type dehydrogenase family enzyme
MAIQFTVTFRPDAIIQQESEGPRLTTQFGAVNLSGMEAALPGITDRIASDRFDEDDLSAWVMGEKGMKGFSVFLRWWRMLQQQACISFTLRSGGRALAQINPLGFRFEFGCKPLEGEGPWLISRFALLRRKNKDMLLECPKAWAEIRVLDNQAGRLLFDLTRPLTSGELANQCGLEQDEVRSLLSMLHCAGALCTVADDGLPDEEHQQALAHWDVHDLYFHSRSRMGRHANGWATTYRFKGRFAPLPQIKSPMSSVAIQLARPDMELLCRTSGTPSFFQVFENRASRREYASEAIRLEQLGEFLYHSFRIKQKYDDELGGVTFRPSPGGGALHSLELYILVKKCEGLGAGLYHYDAMGHRLEKISDPTAHTDRMLFLGRHMMLDQDEPQVEIIYASRFQRIQWKYESIAYSVILKDVGCLYQTMYLVAEALGLSGVALGGGDADLFAAATQLDYFAEGSVGAFMLGSRKPHMSNTDEKGADNGA